MKPRGLKASIYIVLAFAMTACAPAAVPTSRPADPNTAGSDSASASPTATPTPIKVSASKNTSTPFSKNIQISPSQLKNVSPDEILNEVVFTPTGGGMGDCGGKKENYPTVVIEGLKTTWNLLDAPGILTCGWAKDENLIFTLEFPDGRQISKEQTSLQSLKDTNLYYGYSDFQLSVSDPPGAYKVIIKGSSGTLEAGVNILNNIQPGIYELPEDPFSPTYYGGGGGESHLFISGFYPNENARMYFYTRNSNGRSMVSGRTDIKVNESGSIALDVNIPDVVYIAAIGEQTGIIKERFLNPYSGEQVDLKNFTLICPGAKTTRISPGGTIRAAYTDGTNLRVRKDAGFDQEVITSVPEGTEMKTVAIEMPQCQDDTWWWPVILDKKGGWVAEADPDVYLIEPVQ